MRLTSLLIAMACGLAVQCSQSPTMANRGSTTEVVASLQGDLINGDGSSAAGVLVYLRPKNYLPQTNAKIAALDSLKTLASTQTDSLGHFEFDSIAAGIYMLECLGAETETGALIDSVIVTDTDSTTEVAIDTLKPLGAISGQIQLPESLSASQVRVMIYGLDRIVSPDSNGNYAMSRLAEGTYSLRFQVLSNGGIDAAAITLVSGDTAVAPITVLPGADKVRAPRAVGSITLDGVFDEPDWSNARSIMFNKPGLTENLVKVRAVWDSVNLYIAYEVADTMLGGDTTNLLFNDDAVEFYLDPEHDPDTTTDADTVLPVSSAMNTDDIQVFISLNDSSNTYRGQDTIPVVSPISFAVDTTMTGYRMEISIPWSFIGKTPVSGMTMGALFCNDDFDNEFVGQIDWLGLPNWKAPRLWGDLVLE